jgi:hypothetical protein
MRRTRGLSLSFIVRQKLAEASVSHTAAADALGVSRQRFERLLDDGTLQPGDLLELEGLAPGILASWLKGRFRVTPEAAAGTPRDVLGELGDVMGRVGALTGEITGALGGGIDSVEAGRIGNVLEQVRRELGQLEAAVGAAVVVPLRRGGM